MDDYDPYALPWFVGGRYGGNNPGLGPMPRNLPWGIVDPYDPGMNRQNWHMSPYHNYGNAVMDDNYIKYMNFVTGQRDFRDAERAAYQQPAPARMPAAPFNHTTDSWMRGPLYDRIEGFDPDRSYGYVAPERMNELRRRSGGRFAR